MAAQAEALSATLRDLRATRDRARDEYLAATGDLLRNATERGRLWRRFLQANAEYLRAKGRTR